MFNPHLGLQLKGIIDPQEILYGGIARMRSARLLQDTECS